MSDLLVTIALVFIVAGPFLLVANRFDLPSVPLLIVAGVLAGFVLEEALVLELARYGIALLVFAFGIRIDLAGARTVLGDAEWAALGQVLVVGTLGAGLGLAVGLSPSDALFLVVAVAFSSTMVGTALMEVERRQGLVRARLAETIHLVQDLLAIVILLVIGAEALVADAIATQLGYGVVLLVAALLINRYLFDVLGRFAGGSDELLIVGTVSLLVVFVAGAELAGVSIVVGAFAAGLAVRHDPISYPGLFDGIVSIRDFFLAIFFVAIGALVVVPFVELGVGPSLEKLALVAVIVLLTVVIKPIVTTVILLYRGYEARTSTITGLSIDQVSEFALVIAIEALILQQLTPAVFDAIILAAAITMISSDLTQRYDERIYRAVSSRTLLRSTHAKIDGLSEVPEAPSDHVVIVGFGRKGQLLAETCTELGQPFVVIENDPARLESVADACDAYVFGDVMESYTREKAGIDDARIVISTITSAPVSERLLSLDLGADLVLQTESARRALSYLERGALYVSVANVLAGEELVAQLRDLFAGEVDPDELRNERIAALEEYAATIRAPKERHAVRAD